MSIEMGAWGTVRPYERGGRLGAGTRVQALLPIGDMWQQSAREKGAKVSCFSWIVRVATHTAKLASKSPPKAKARKA